MSLEFANFSSLQSLESRVLARMPSVTDALAKVDWFVEVAPVTSPSPVIQTSAKKQRVLFEGQQSVWPFESRLDALPIDTNSVPAIMIRHAWRLPIDASWIAQWARVLKPGGWWIAVSANPWHPSIWRQLGRRSLYLPSWPHFLWSNFHAGIELEIKPFAGAKLGVPRISPILVVVGRKRGAVSPIRIRPKRSLNPSTAVAAVTQCRAA